MDVTPEGAAILAAVGRSLDLARRQLRNYMVVPADHILHPALTWADSTMATHGFCYSSKDGMPYDGACVVICLKDRGHGGDCGGADLVTRVDRSDEAQVWNPLTVMTWQFDQKRYELPYVAKWAKRARA